MIPGWKEIRVTQEHFEDLRREVRADRLARDVQANGEQSRAWSPRLVGWLARQVGTWGPLRPTQAQMRSQPVDCGPADA